MPSKTDFNVSPYYDDFSEDKKFHRVMYRPAFAVQARELTTQQSINQHQIEQMGDHLFKHGAVVIPPEVLPKLGAALETMFAAEKIVLEPAREEGFDFEAFEKAWSAFEKART